MVSYFFKVTTEKSKFCMPPGGDLLGALKRQDGATADASDAKKAGNWIDDLRGSNGMIGAICHDFRSNNLRSVKVLRLRLKFLECANMVTVEFDHAVRVYSSLRNEHGFQQTPCISVNRPVYTVSWRNLNLKSSSIRAFVIFLACKFRAVKLVVAIERPLPPPSPRPSCWQLADDRIGGGYGSPKSNLVLEAEMLTSWLAHWSLVSARRGRFSKKEILMRFRRRNVVCCCFYEVLSWRVT